MKNALLAFVLFLCAFVATCPAQTTPYLNFNIPNSGTQSWNVLYNANFTALDNYFSGNTVSPVSVCTFNGVATVGGNCASAWGGGDIGAQVNVAYTLLPAGGGAINIKPGNYSFSTPITATTVGKPLTLSCASGTSDNVPSHGATVLTYTGSSGTAVSIAGGNQNEMNGCTLVGPGTTGSTVGLLVGGLSGSTAAIQSTFALNDISNFGVGLKFGQNSFLDTFINNHIHGNGMNLYVPSGMPAFGENILFLGGSFANDTSAYSATCVDVESGGSLHFVGVSFDQCGSTFNFAGGSIDLFGDHWEDPDGGTSLAYITIGTACNICTFNIKGGDMVENNAVGRTTFISEASTVTNNAVNVSIEGTTFTSQESIPVANTTGGAAGCCQRIAVRDYEPGTNISGPFAGSWLGTIFQYAGTLAITGQLTIPQVQVVGPAPGCTFTSGGGTSPSCIVDSGSTNAAGTIIATTGSGSPAGTGTITLTFSSTFGTNAPVCQYMASNHAAGQWSGLAVMQDKTPSTSSDLFTWTNGATPTALSASTVYRINYQCWAK